MRITIIGAGLCGTALACELAKLPLQDVEVCLVGDARTFGRGIAYGSARKEHYLNVRADEIGLEPDHPQAFADWLELGESTRSTFLPRDVYGDYMTRQLSAAINAASAKISLQPLEAVALERAANGYRVVLADGSNFFSDRVVLAVGALPPQPLPMIEGGLAQHPAYVGWPWNEGALDGIGTDARVLIVGTGLTMVDVATTLHARDHRGPIRAISRHGLLPQSHGPLRRSAPVPAALARALTRGDLRGLLRCVRQLSRVVEDWRVLIDAVRPHAQRLWQQFTPAQRGAFMRHLRSHWDVHRHRIAPHVARELEALLGEDRLGVAAGRLLHARLRGEEIETFLHLRGEAHARTERFDVLIRATGLDTDVSKTHHALLAHLREAGLVQADPLGLGIATTHDGELLDARHRRVPGVFCLGALRRGQLWESIAIPELRAAARQLAPLLVGARVATDAIPERQRDYA